MKTTAYFLTGSVGLLSDALESIVNLVAAAAALIALIVVDWPADEDHAYGHGKAEYFSSGFEGGLIVLTAGSIIAVAIPRLLHPEPLAEVGLGLAISVPGSILNGAVAWRLMRAGKQYNSITLEADGRHLLADIWSSVGVVVGVAAVAVTGWERLDPVIALLVAANIVWTGIGLVRRSMLGLLDTALPAEERDIIQAILERNEREYRVQTHALRTRQAAARRFVSVHVIVPGGWTVHHGHRLVERIEREIREAVPMVTVTTHLESLDDPASWADTHLDRDDERSSTRRKDQLYLTSGSYERPGPTSLARLAPDSAMSQWPLHRHALAASKLLISGALRVTFDGEGRKRSSACSRI